MLRIFEELDIPSKGSSASPNTLLFFFCLFFIFCAVGVASQRSHTAESNLVWHRKNSHQFLLLLTKHAEHAEQILFIRSKHQVATVLL